jgi:hypothetical protein
MPPAAGFHDDAGLFTERDRARLREAVALFTDETLCPMTVQVLKGAARTHWGEHGPDGYAVRAYLRSHLPSRPDLTDEQRWAELPPAALLFVFVTARQPLRAEMSFHATPDCLPYAVANGLLVDIEPRFPLAPAEALLAVPALASRGKRGLWTPPPPLSAEEYLRRAEEIRDSQRTDLERVLLNALEGKNASGGGSLSRSSSSCPGRRVGSSASAARAAAPPGRRADRRREAPPAPAGDRRSAGVGRREAGNG